MKKTLLISVFILFSLVKVSQLNAQEFPFRSTVYYLRMPNNSLISSGLTLNSFNFNSANRLTDSLFTDGIYFPANDCFGHNLWIRLRHISEDPNGNTIGININNTSSNPCQSEIMIGGWAGFLYDFEIHEDINLQGERGYLTGPLYPTSITVASLETLSGACGGSEWLSFKIINPSSTGWSLNSTVFTGNNPNSNPAFSDSMHVYTTGSCYPPDGFSYTFPEGTDSISAINGNASGYSEFKMSAGSVSHFQYGYEYDGQGSGYQGMSMAFGAPPTFTVSAIDVTCKDGVDGQIDVNISGGIGPFTYQWNNGNVTGESLTNLPFGEYHLVVTDQNGCGSVDTTVTISEPQNVSVVLDSLQLINVSCFGNSDGILSVAAHGISDLSYLWNIDSTTASLNGLPAGDYSVTISDQNSCLYLSRTITEPLPINTTIQVIDNQLISDETEAEFQWIDCSNDQNILNEISNHFSPLVSGSYKLAINKSGCIDTSDCIDVIITSLETKLNSTLQVFPNPTSGELFLDFGKPNQHITLQLFDLRHQLVFEQRDVNEKTIQLNLKQAAGIYWLSITSTETIQIRKVLLK